MVSRTWVARAVVVMLMIGALSAATATAEVHQPIRAIERDSFTSVKLQPLVEHD